MKINLYRFFLLCIAICILAFIACEVMYTTSFAKPFTRKDISLKNASIKQLLDITKNEAIKDPALAKEVLNALADKPKKEILALSVDDKTKVLELATTSAIDLSKLSKIADAFEKDESEENEDETVERIMEVFDTDMDLKAVEIIISDKDTLDNAPVETIVFATAVLIADVAKQDKDVFDLLAKEDPSDADIAAVIEDPTQQERVRVIVDARKVLKDRDENINILGFSLEEILGG